MRTENATQHFIRRPQSLVLVGVFVFLAAAVAVPFYSVRSSSLRTTSSKLNVPSGQSVRASELRSVASSNINQTSLSSTFASLLPIPQATPPPVATYDGATCSVPQSDFFLGDTVCAKASGIPVSLFPWHITWVDPVGFVRQSDIASTNDQTEYRYTLPTDPTTNINGQTVDNRGTWRVNVTRPNGAIRSTALFVVHEAANPLSDVFVQKFIHSASPSVAAGDNISFSLVVGNAGPDPAANVHLVDSVPAGGTLVQFTQNSGPQCVVVGDGPANDCTIAAMTNGDRAEFTAIYNTGSAAPGDYQTSATVSSTTTDPNASNNTSTAPYSVTPSTGGTTCQIPCPGNNTTPAKTPQNRQPGAPVNYPDPVRTRNWVT